MGVEWAAIGVVLAAGALCIGFPLGTVFGYAWRDRISRVRRLRAKQEWQWAERDRAAMAFARSPAKVAGTDGKRRKKPTEAKLEVVRSDVLQQPSPR
jgi:hypothetical protein